MNYISDTSTIYTYDSPSDEDHSITSEIGFDFDAKDNLNLRPEDVNNKITDMIREIKEVGGMLVTIWHNDTFSNYGSWKGWKNVYENMVKLIKQ